MLRIEHLSRIGFFKDVSFNVHAGEIVGLTGLVGAGRTEVMEAVCGITRPDEGKVFLEGKEIYIKTPSDAMEKRYHPSSRGQTETGSGYELGTWKKRNTSDHQQICKIRI